MFSFGITTDNFEVFDNIESMATPAEILLFLMPDEFRCIRDMPLWAKGLKSFISILNCFVQKNDIKG